jgi:endo-alpha-1,4-polygalactosaminidase (GH114 family)
MHPIKRITALSILGFQTIFGQSKQDLLVCYGKFDVNQVKGYQTIILEPAQFTKNDIDILKKNNIKIYGYLSLGEVSRTASFYPLLKDEVLGKNEHWNSYYLNLSSAKTKRVLLELIKSISNKGVHGLFIDNVDNFSSFGPQKEQQKEFLDFLKLIKSKFPELEIIQNAGSELLSQTNSIIKGILFESIFTNYLFHEKKYVIRSGDDFEQQFKKVEIAKKYKHIHIYLIEYANSTDAIDKIKRAIFKLQVSFFIGTIDLQALPKPSLTKLKSP